MTNEEIITTIFSEKPKQLTRLSGGDINEVYSVCTSKKACVIKLNKADLFPQMLEKEGQGLTLIAATETLKTPAVIDYGTIDNVQFLALEKIEPGAANKKTWTIFGEQLAYLHLNTTAQFGLDHNNYIGSLVQQNGLCNTWAEFLITQRLQPMIKMAVNQGDINYVEAKIIEPFYKRIDELYPDEKPALLHGDLWSGNYLVDKSGAPVLIDPAVYYGHREMDIGMMHLFGGFAPELFDSYHTTYPLEKGWKDRVALNQLYPLLVHVNLFGRSYWEQVAAILRRYE